MQLKKILLDCNHFHKIIPDLDRPDRSSKKYVLIYLEKSIFLQVLILSFYKYNNIIYSSLISICYKSHHPYNLVVL